MFILLCSHSSYTLGQAVTMPTVLPTVQRETAANIYSSGAWYMAKTLSDLPWDLSTTFFLATVTYWAVGFTDDAANYGYYLLILALVALLATGFGHMMGSVVTSLGKPHLAMPLTISTLLPMFLFSGLLANFNTIPDHMLWLQYISIFYYSFSLVSMNQWKDYGDIDCTKEDLKIGPCAFRDVRLSWPYLALLFGQCDAHCLPSYYADPSLFLTSTSALGNSYTTFNQ